MRRILVTGGTGFLGSHLCHKLASGGAHIIAFDNFFTGRHENLNLLSSPARLEVVRGDVCDPFHFDVDEIYHLACPASPVHYQRNPVRTIRTCVEGTLNALECARNSGARILIASTSEVYGDPEVHPQVESYWGNANPIGPRACYDEGKRCAEALATSYSRQYGIEVRIARIFNCYGPRMSIDDGRVVSNFICQALRDESLTVYGDGSQTRSFIYVTDLVDGLVRLMNVDGYHPVDLDASTISYVSGNNTPVNLGNPSEYKIGELAEKVIALVGRGRVEYRDLPQDDPTRRKPDIARARALLGWEPSIDLDYGLYQTVAYFARELGLSWRTQHELDGSQTPLSDRPLPAFTSNL